MAQKFHVPKLADKKIYHFFEKVKGVIGGDVQVNIVGIHRQIRLNFDSPEDFEKRLKKSNDQYIYNASIHGRGLAVNFRRWKDDDPNAFRDHLELQPDTSNPPSHTLSSDDLAEVQGALSETFFKPRADGASFLREDPALASLIASHERITDRLNEMSVSVGEKLVEARADLDREYAERKLKLEADIERKQKEIDAKAKAAADALAKQQEDVERRAKELDDRNNTHMRRALHNELKTKIAARAESLRVAPETRKERQPVHLAVAVASIALFALLAIVTQQWMRLPNDASAYLVASAAIKTGSLTLALLGVMAWYLRWLNRWSERYAEAEFQLKQFDLDIDRASWVVEAALEWKIAQDKQMPDHLLEAISRNLFVRSEKDEGADMHPADYLASALIGRASSVELEVPGGKVAIQQKGLRQLQKEPPKRRGKAAAE